MTLRVALVLSLALLISTGLVVHEWKKHNSFRNGIADVDFGDSASDILETIFAEGYGSAKIDYNDPVFLQRQVFLLTDIDSKSGEAVMLKLKHLDSVAPGQPIDLYIDSNGGSGGYMISNFLQTLKSPVNTYALDWCCSSGAEILAAGSGRRYAFETARIAVHIVPQEDRDSDSKDYGRVKMEQVATRSFWQQFTRLPKEIVDSKENMFFNLSAQQALQYGLIDEIIPKKVLPVSHDSIASPPQPSAPPSQP